MMPDTRTCRVCGQTKPTDEFYRRHRRTCRFCVATRAAAWNVAHPDRRHQINRASDRRRMSDPKKREDARLACRLWRLRNREKHREAVRRWKRRNAERVRKYQCCYHRRRARHDKP